MGGLRSPVRRGIAGKRPTARGKFDPAPWPDRRKAPQAYPRSDSAFRRARGRSRHPRALCQRATSDPAARIRRSLSLGPGRVAAPGRSARRPARALPTYRTATHQVTACLRAGSSGAEGGPRRPPPEERLAHRPTLHPGRGIAAEALDPRGEGSTAATRRLITRTDERRPRWDGVVGPNGAWTTRRTSSRLPSPRRWLSRTPCRTSGSRCGCACSGETSSPPPSVSIHVRIAGTESLRTSASSWSWSRVCRSFRLGASRARPCGSTGTSSRALVRFAVHGAMARQAYRDALLNLTPQLGV
jgi:hypothetical protein